MPYTTNILDLLTNICREGRDLWPANLFLIYFHIMEMHLLDRVMRQFNGIQRIPQNYEKGHDQIYKIDLREKGNEEWKWKNHKFN